MRESRARVYCSAKFSGGVRRRVACATGGFRLMGPRPIGFESRCFFQMGLGVLAVPMFKIYVGNLDPRVKIEHVRELFAPFVTIEDAVLAEDATTGKPKGFAIVMIRDPELGRAAVKATQGKRLLGKTLTINEVMKKGAVAAKAPKETRQGPFGPHFNRQGGGRAGAPRGGVRRGLNRGPRGPGFGPSAGAGGSYGRPGPIGPGSEPSGGLPPDPQPRPFQRRPDDQQGRPSDQGPSSPSSDD